MFPLKFRKHFSQRLQLLLLVLTTLVLTACQEPPGPNEPYPNSTLTLETLDVSSTTAWLKISLTNIDSITSTTVPVILKRDGETISTLDFAPLLRPGSGRADTTIMDAGLEPNRNYSYKAYRQSIYNTALIDSSVPLTLTTLDTTSHNFTWTIDTLGSYGSYFKDVAIIDENNIWAVGNIVVPDPDSSFNGTGWKEYNAARWDGERWNLMGIYSNTLDLYSIFYFSENDIWVLGSYPIHWDGESWIHYHLTNMGIIPGGLSNGAIWGSSPDDVYFVGGHGRIVHYDGSGFTRLESGTDIKLLDIYGLDANRIWSSGYNDHTGRSVLLEYDGNIWHKKYEYGQAGSESIVGTVWNTIWSSNNTLYLPTVNGLWQENIQAGQGYFTNWHSILYNYYQVVKLRGNGDNDFMFITNWSECFHFNGVTWKYYTELNNTAYPAIPHSLDMQSNIAVIAGRSGDDSGAIVMRGYR